MNIKDLKNYTVVSSAGVKPSVAQEAQVPLAEKKTSIFGKIGEAFNSRVGNAQAAQQKTVEGKQGLLSGTLQTIGQGAGFVGDVAGEAAMGIGKALLPKAAENAIASKVGQVANSDAVQKAMKAYEQLKQSNPELLANLESVVNIGSLIPVGAIGKTGATVAAKGADNALEAISKAGANAAENSAKKLNPLVTAEKAAGQILQGKEGAVKPGLEALKLVETKGAKTFKELDSRMTDKVKELAREVDDDLALDATPTKLADLSLIRKTNAGDVSVNYVDNALKQLDELYTSTGDAVESANIKSMIQSASDNGLTKKEVNDIARTYGQEFGKKAFNKVGEPLTSVNAQMFENTRKGLKDTARQGITGERAKVADQAMSRILNTQTLIKKNAEAVNKLKQKIEERGLLEKVGHGVSKYADIITGGGLRGFVGGLLPRGAGYKTLNALDLEELLERNLKIINEASKAKTAPQFKSKINELFQKNINTDKAVTSFLDRNKNTPGKQGGFAKLPFTKSESNLVSEAKKYKSAEEFVKAQNQIAEYSPLTQELTDRNIKLLNKSGIPVKSGDDLLTLYHGTNTKGLKGINESKSLNPLSYLATDRKASERFVFGKGNVLEIKVPVKDAGFVQTSMAGTKGASIQNPVRLIKGEDGVWRAEKWNNKSELSDIWNRANKSGTRKVKIGTQDLGELRDFNDYVYGGYKPTSKEAVNLEIAARRIVEKLKLGKPDVSNKQLALTIGRLLDKKIKP